MCIHVYLKSVARLKMVKKKHKKNKKEIDREVLKNAGFDEGEIWRLDFKGEMEYEENVVGKFVLSLIQVRE